MRRVIDTSLPTLTFRDDLSASDGLFKLAGALVERGDRQAAADRAATQRGLFGERKFTSARPPKRDFAPSHVIDRLTTREDVIEIPVTNELGEPVLDQDGNPLRRKSVKRVPLPRGVAEFKLRSAGIHPQGFHLDPALRDARFEGMGFETAQMLINEFTEDGGQAPPELLELRDQLLRERNATEQARDEDARRSLTALAGGNPLAQGSQPAAAPAQPGLFGGASPDEADPVAVLPSEDPQGAPLVGRQALQPAPAPAPADGGFDSLAAAQPVPAPQSQDQVASLVAETLAGMAGGDGGEEGGLFQAPAAAPSAAPEPVTEPELSVADVVDRVLQPATDSAALEAVLPDGSRELLSLPASAALREDPALAAQFAEIVLSGRPELIEAAHRRLSGLE